MNLGFPAITYYHVCVFWSDSGSVTDCIWTVLPLAPPFGPSLVFSRELEQPGGENRDGGEAGARGRADAAVLSHSSSVALRTGAGPPASV